jgi:hypothetical protein
MRIKRPSTVVDRVGASIVAAACACGVADAQTPAPAAAADAAASAKAAAAAPALNQLAWLRGCWTGSVNRRDFLEQWLPLRADMMVGVSHTVIQDPLHKSETRTQDYTYLRLEARPDGVYYIAVPSGKKEIAFKLASVEDDKGAKIFTFLNSVDEFPQRIVYRRAEHEWLFAQVAGTVDGQKKEVTYPMQHVDCANGAFVDKRP